MPLPNVIKGAVGRCRAHSKRSGSRCLNLCAYGSPVCRMHGARRPNTALRDKAHPNYQHGQETLSAKALRSAKLSELRQLENVMYLLGLIEGPRTPGRRPKIS